MADLFTSSEKSDLESVFDDLHDTFGRNMIAYKEATKTIISTNTDFNYLYKNVQGDATRTIRKVAQYKTIKARILYEDKQRETLYDAETSSQIKVDRPVGSVRIKVDKEGYLYLKDSKRIELDGKNFVFDSEVRPFGLFSPTHYTFYLRPAE